MVSIVRVRATGIDRLISGGRAAWAWFSDAQCWGQFERHVGIPPLSSCAHPNPSSEIVRLAHLCAGSPMFYKAAMALREGSYVLAVPGAAGEHAQQAGAWVLPDSASARASWGGRRRWLRWTGGPACCRACARATPPLRLPAHLLHL